MSIELITCRSCGTRNASHRTVCLRCGASTSTPTGTKIAKRLSPEDLTVQLHRNLQHECPKTDAAFEAKYAAATGAVWSAGPVLFNSVNKHLGEREIKREWFLLFNAEVTCYVLHVLDRTLAMPAFASSRTKVMDHLVLHLCDAFRFVLDEMGYPQFSEDELTKGVDGKTFLDRGNEQLKQLVLKGGLQVPAFATLVVNGFIEMCNERQLEYGALKKDSWFGDVALRFGQHAADALECDKATMALHCGLLAPDVFKELVPSLLSLADADT